MCFITYDINLHFYNLPEDPNGEPSIIWVGEVQDPFVPMPKEKMMLNLVKDRERIDAFLDKLVNIHQLETKKYQSHFLCTGAAISAAKQLLHDNGNQHCSHDCRRKDSCVHFRHVHSRIWPSSK